MPNGTGLNGLADLRRSKGMTQEDLAALAHVRSTTISRIERGMVTPKLRTALRIAEALGITVAELVGAEKAAS